MEQERTIVSERRVPMPAPSASGGAGESELLQRVEQWRERARQAYARIHAEGQAERELELRRNRPGQ